MLTTAFVRLASPTYVDGQRAAISSDFVTRHPARRMRTSSASKALGARMADRCVAGGAHQDGVRNRRSGTPPFDFRLKFLWPSLVHSFENCRRLSAMQTKDFIIGYFGALSGKAKPMDLLKRNIADAYLLQPILELFPPVLHPAEDRVAEGSKVAVLENVRGVHQEEFAGIEVIASWSADANGSVQLLEQLRSNRARTSA